MASASKPLAVITGASSGIGQVFARRLAPDYDLLLIARRHTRLEALAGELRAQQGARVEVLAADLTAAAEVRAVAHRIAGESTLELLVNNAGFGLRGPFWTLDLDALERMHRLHVLTIVTLTHAALGVMTARNRGALINVASVAAFATRAGSAAYGATKSWLVAFTAGLHFDLQHAKSAVTVQALCPGFTYSGFHDVMGEERQSLAPPPWWLTAEHVVDDSLRALAGGSLSVVPGWRYKGLVALLSVAPLWLKLRLQTAGSR